MIGRLASPVVRLLACLVLVFSSVPALAASPTSSGGAPGSETGALAAERPSLSMSASTSTGEWIVFRRDDLLYRIAPDGTDERALGQTNVPLVPGHTVQGLTVIARAPSGQPRLVNVAEGTSISLDVGPGPGASGIRDLGGNIAERERAFGFSVLLLEGRSWTDELPVVLSHDGRHAAVVHRDGEDRQIRLVDAVTGQLRTVLTCKDPIWLLKFSPDGGRLLVVRGDVPTLTPPLDETLLINVETGQISRVPMLDAQGDMAVNAAFSPDARSLAFSTLESTVRLVELDDFRTVWKVEVGLTTWLEFAPDGMSLMLIDSARDGHRLRTLSRKDGTDERLLASKLAYDAAAYFIDDHTLAIMTGGTLMDLKLAAVQFDTGQPVPLAMMPPGSSDVHIMWLSGARQGDAWLFAHGAISSTAPARAFLLRPDGSLLKPLGDVTLSRSNSETVGRGWFAPAGDTVVFECGIGSEPDLCLADTSPSSTGIRRLTSGRSPVWTR